MHEMLTKYEKFIILKMRDEGLGALSISVKLNRPKAIISDYLINKEKNNKDIIKELKSCKKQITESQGDNAYYGNLSRVERDEAGGIKQNVEIGHRRITQYVHDITATSMGDPVPGRSALDKKQNAGWYL